ncbi:hypothetical protein Rumeso_02794 [Rubellimicrobium mesophilum DSM 19309]|uniref:DUF1440 domain-containing protein n=1 Tax=Rubellimicrobium mesophilum DSM 19309 TaxID=442562 RepID=A0A017HMH2_9RHOB|nr:hypothetical protein Rumeso_02794 [Rubellimicrobium mesophilum DSM 19309]
MMVKGWPETEELGQRQGDGTGATLLKGTLAGLAATVALDRLDWFMWDHLDPATRERTRSVRPDGLDPGHVIARKVAQAMGTDIEPRGPDNQSPAGVAVHAAMGLAPALAYAALRDRVPAMTAGRGTLFGLGLFLMQDEGLNTLTGLGARPQDYPWQAHARGLIAHLVYGAVLEATMRALDGPPGERRDA